MAERKIVILKDSIENLVLESGTKVVTFCEAAGWFRKGTILKHFFRYSEACVITNNSNLIYRPFLTAVMARLLSRGYCYFKYEAEECTQITFCLLIKLMLQTAGDYLRKPGLLSRINCELHALSDEKSTASSLDLSNPPVYLRTDLWFGIRAGGSVGHISGVLNNLGHFSPDPLFLTTDHIPMVKEDISTYVISPERAFGDFKELPSLNFNKVFTQNASKILDGTDISFVYQRYSVNNYSGVKLARRYDVPFVLEYNGSEIWITRNWGRKFLKYESLSENIELLNLKAADVIVVVSESMKDELAERGFEDDKILVNPNGVDTDWYSPYIDGSEIRKQYSMDGNFVIGFIGTFGPWHGAGVLAEAFGSLIGNFPEYRQRVRLFMIGDGPVMPEVKEKLAKFNVMDACTLTGLIPQEKGAEYLAACDILVSPHVRNPDGTPFFGSPTKLFEYMAVGKGIIASNLNQIGQILEHKCTAWLTEPGDVKSLENGLKVLIDNPELCREMGKNARKEVVEKYTWRKHTQRIIEKLKERCNKC